MHVSEHPAATTSRKSFLPKQKAQKPGNTQTKLLEALARAKTDAALVEAQTRDLSPEARGALLRQIQGRTQQLVGHLRRRPRRAYHGPVRACTLKNWTGFDRRPPGRHMPASAILRLFPAIPVFELPHVSEACPALMRWQTQYLAEVERGRIPLKTAAIRRFRAELGLPEETPKTRKRGG